MRAPTAPAQSTAAATTGGHPTICVRVLDRRGGADRRYIDEPWAALGARPHYGHHPLLCYLDASGEGVAGVLRAGSAGSLNTASDHRMVLQLALQQLDEQALGGEILVRADGAGATHELTAFCRDGPLRFSVGFDLDQRVRDAIVGLSDAA